MASPHRLQWWMDEEFLGMEADTTGFYRTKKHLERFVSYDREFFWAGAQKSRLNNPSSKGSTQLPQYRPPKHGRSCDEPVSLQIRDTPHTSTAVTRGSHRFSSQRRLRFGYGRDVRPDVTPALSETLTHLLRNCRAKCPPD
jgi:hypothetical protein